MMRKAFTLIELLIVVAIIAILAAIAVPNFLEAQTRAKVSRAKADIRTLATALESYAVDTNAYPPDITYATVTYVQGFDFTQGGYYWYISNWITSPISYISSNNILDPFRDKRSTLSPEYLRFRYVNLAFGDTYYTSTPGSTVVGAVSSAANYRAAQSIWGRWRISSSGPDASAGAVVNGTALFDPTLGFPGKLTIYDPTNGTVSPGDIVRSQAEPEPHHGTAF